MTDASIALQQYLRAVGERLQRGDLAAAMRLAEQAVSQGLQEPNLLVLAGQGRMRGGKPDRALPLLQKALDMAPDNIEALNGLGLCLAQLGRTDEACAMFDQALALSPQTAYLNLHKAQVLEDGGRFNAAQALLEEFLTRDDTNPAALARLAGLCARRGAMAGARAYGERALAIQLLPAATIAIAMADLEEGRFEDAWLRLSPLVADSSLTPVNLSIARGLMGDALDRLDRIEEAFAAYVAARDVLRQAAAPLFAGKETATDRVRRIAAHIKSAPHRPPAQSAVPCTHVFLVGFPRSGTTLLEQVLACHPDIQTLEEGDCLADTVRDFVDAPGGLDRFDRLDEIELVKYRELYWQRVGPRRGARVFVDKMPLNSIHLELVARLFPEARILFAVRDPRDVVLSCFRRRLVMTAHMVEFTRLERAAGFYDAVMDLAKLQRDRLTLPVLDVRHEDLVADFEAVARRVCDFLEVTWDPAMADFAMLARTRDIKTPSALQIVRGLNDDGVGQWRRYRAQLAPVLPVLARWVVQYGYPPT